MNIYATAGEIAGRAAEAISDLHGSQEYKEHIVGVLLKRAFQNRFDPVLSDTKLGRIHVQGDVKTCRYSNHSHFLYPQRPALQEIDVEPHELLLDVYAIV